MHEFKNNRESKLEQLKKEISKKKGDLAKQTTAVKAMQKEVQTSELELEQMDKDIESSGEEVLEAGKQVEKSKKEAAALDDGIKRTQKEHDKLKAQYNEETRQLSAFHRELADLDKARKRKEAEIADLDVEEKKITHDLERLAADSKKTEKDVKNLENKYTWIADESASFGKTGTIYDFSAHDMNAARATCSDLSERQQGRSKKINPKVMVMIDQVEKQEKELLKMYSQVTKDKVKIEETIAKLDDYKRVALQKTWEKVNGDFGAIFGELLPGNFSKLQPPEGMDITEGLEVKVRLGQVWKQSLTELSGGQRCVHYAASPLPVLILQAQIAYRAFPHHVATAIQACADVYFGRGRCSAGSFAYAAHRSSVPDTLPWLPIHRGIAEGGTGRPNH